VEQQEAGHHCSLNDGRRMPGRWSGGLTVCVFPLVGPVTIACDSKAALPLCKDDKEGQRVKNIDIIHHSARIIGKVGSWRLCTASLRTGLRAM
jgi:hypothetical protein